MSEARPSGRAALRQSTVVIPVNPTLINGHFRLLTAVGFLLTAIATSTLAQTTEPSREPILQIETGMHTAMIRRIGVDAGNRFLVTASEDKTVRVWELPSGRLLRVIRVPIGAGNEGKLFAVAISPDGNTIAAGGWTRNENGEESIYLFDRESGLLTRRLGGLPNVVRHLVYSPDGRYLAATLGGNGVRVFSTVAYAAVGKDTDYGDSSYAADFDSAAKLVTSSMDGFVRLYATGINGSLRLLTKRRAEGGQQPNKVKFSPDGSRIAVGFVDSTKVTVLRASDLTPLYSPDTTGVNGNLASVAWSADGRKLYAGGSAGEPEKPRIIRSWTESGRGGYHDIADVAVNTIFDILPLSNGGFIYSSAEPSFGVIDANDKRQLFITAAIAVHQGKEGFLLSPDAAEVGFSCQPLVQWGSRVIRTPEPQSPARFSLTDRRLDTNLVGGSNLRPAETEDSNLRVTDWNGSDVPKLNGKALKIDQYEFSRSLALAPDRSAFLLGTEFSLRLFDRNGSTRWRVAAPGSNASAVNISADGKLAVAAFGDGTIRWYRMTDGNELLAFFLHADRKRWVLWTPSGYYDASPGAEEMIGWHVNNGKDQAADFFPVGQFRSTYYRPDVISRILQTGDERLALQQSNEAAGRKEQESTVAQQLPPVVEITSPSDSSEVSSTEIAVRFRVRTPSGEPVTSVKALVDGRPMGARQLVREAATSNVDGMRELRVTVPERDSEIAIIAENRFTTSVPATVRVKWHSATAARPEAFVVKPKLYILAVGVSQYADSKFNLKLADKDAGDFVKVMMAQKDLLYRDVVVKLLTNEKATKDDVLDGLDWIRQETTSNDVAMVFLAGHGVNDQNNYYYFCPYNVDPSRLLRTGVAFSDIKKTVSAIAGKALFFVDSCHSGNAIGLAARRGPLDINIVINELSSAENGVVVFSASTGSESSYEREEWNNGAFTKALVEGLGGAASIGNTGRITYNMLNVYISERVKELTKGQQHPTMISPQTVPDFPIAVKK
jgi:WD40 repeat protein